jgi:hypothetical protein
VNKKFGPTASQNVVRHFVTCILVFKSATFSTTPANQTNNYHSSLIQHAAVSQEHDKDMEQNSFIET